LLNIKKTKFDLFKMYVLACICRPNFLFSCGRSSPIWIIPQSAKEPIENPYLESLSRPKPVHQQYLPCRGVETIIPRSALNARVTDRLATLATPRERPEGPFRDPIWPVSMLTFISSEIKDYEFSSFLSKIELIKNGYLLKQSLTNLYMIFS
jgi:hypothetical protein